MVVVWCGDDDDDVEEEAALVHDLFLAYAINEEPEDCSVVVVVSLIKVHHFVNCFVLFRFAFHFIFFLLFCFYYFVIVVIIVFI